MQVITTSNTRGHIDDEARAYIDALEPNGDGATLRFLATTPKGPFVVRWNHGDKDIRGTSNRSLALALKAVVDQVVP